MNKIKLSVLVYSLASGGAEKVVSSLLRELSMEYDIILVLMNKTIFYDVHKNLKIIYLENSNPLENGIKKLFKLPFLSLKYKKICRDNSIDISLSFMNRPNYINILTKMMGIKNKVIISERAMPSLQHKKGIQGFINRLLIRYLYAKADIITANSRGNSLDLKNNFAIDEVVTINNPLDLDKIEKLAQEEVNMNDRKNKFLFISIGRLDVGKNHKLMIKAMQYIDDALLYIIGDGFLKNELENQITELSLKDKVFLLGSKSNPYKYLSQADCFLLTSNNEGFPNVILEALACQLPIISTDCQSGPREILCSSHDIKTQLKDDIELLEYGILTPVNDLDSFIKSMKLIMNNEALRYTYKSRAINRVNDFKVADIIQKWIDILKVTNE